MTFNFCKSNEIGFSESGILDKPVRTLRFDRPADQDLAQRRELVVRGSMPAPRSAESWNGATLAHNEALSNSAGEM
jgi:hypothetical protein